MCRKARQEAVSNDFLLCFVLVGVRGFEPLPFVLCRSFASTASAFCAQRSSTFAEVLGGVVGVAV